MAPSPSMKQHDPSLHQPLAGFTSQAAQAEGPTVLQHQLLVEGRKRLIPGKPAAPELEKASCSSAQADFGQTLPVLSQLPLLAGQAC